MPAAGVLVSPAILVAAALLCWILGPLGRGVRRWKGFARPSQGGRMPPYSGRGAPRIVTGAAAWLAGAAAVAYWALQRQVPADLQMGLGAASIHLRMDAVALAFELLLLVPMALLMSFHRRSGGEAGLAMLAGALALLTVEADRLLPAAAGFAACLTLVEVLRGAPLRPPSGLGAAWLLLLWAAVTLEGLDGTSEYGAVPVAALGTALFGLLALAGLLAAGLVPWRNWATGVWSGSDGPLAAAIVTPLGFLFLFRTYQLGAGRWPSPWLHLIVAAVGAAAALGAAVRSQAAGSRRQYLAESATLTGGLALLGLALGSPLGLTAALAALAGGALQAGLAPILPAGRRPVTLLGLAVAAGVPPALLFGGRLLALQAAMDSAGVYSFLGLAGTLAWLIGVAGAARAVRLPDAEEAAEQRGAGGRMPPSGRGGAGGLTPSSLEGQAAIGHVFGAWCGIALMLAAGVGLAGVVTLVAAPAAGEVLSSQPPNVAGGYLAISTPSGGWSAALLGGPLALGLCLMLLWSFRPRRRGDPSPEAEGAAPEPYFDIPQLRLLERGRARLADLGLTVEAAALPGRLVAAAGSGSPWLWAVITIAALVAVSR